jgi:hypothetical protein
MRTTMKNVICNNFLLASIILLALFQLTACEEESADEKLAAQLVGSWGQVERTIDGNITTKDSTRLAMQINASNICILCDSTVAAQQAKSILKRSGWNCSGGLFNVAIDLPASWKAEAESNTLSLEKVEFNATGNLTKTVIRFNRVASLELN